MSHVDSSQDVIAFPHCRLGRGAAAIEHTAVIIPRVLMGMRDGGGRSVACTRNPTVLLAAQPALELAVEPTSNHELCSHSSVLMHLFERSRR